MGGMGMMGGNPMGMSIGGGMGQMGQFGGGGMMGLGSDNTGQDNSGMMANPAFSMMGGMGGFGGIGMGTCNHDVNTLLQFDDGSVVKENSSSVSDSNVGRFRLVIAQEAWECLG